MVYRKGKLNPISIAIKIRQGRKAVTLITGFEPFSVNADDLGEELRKLCAAQTSGASSLLFLLLLFGSPTFLFPKQSHQSRRSRVKWKYLYKVNKEKQ